MQHKNAAPHRLLLLGTLLLGGVVAQQERSLSARMARMAGTGLTIAQTRERMHDLGTMLGEAGYGPARTHSLSDGTLASRWYNSGDDRTALAFAGQAADGNAFSVVEQSGLVRMNDLIAIP
ncbi:hypothetical protein [Deinococcus hohokamensis]|uniref:Uncharacterized protein n=1 Tax=Deinococcus hohokamensis TaxID=309883 RepID=A0ABV9I9A0_9DEIO